MVCKSRCATLPSPLSFLSLSLPPPPCLRLASNFDHPVRTLAGNQAVSGGDISVDEMLLFQVMAAMGHIKSNLDLLSQSEQRGTLRGEEKKV